jgi:hypothetical protein
MCVSEINKSGDIHVSSSVTWHTPNIRSVMLLTEYVTTSGTW